MGRSSRQQAGKRLVNVSFTSCHETLAGVSLAGRTPKKGEKMPVGPNSHSCQEARAQFLSGLASDLRRGRVTRVRVTPLLLNTPITHLTERRKRLFVNLVAEREEWGLQIGFRRRVRPTSAHPQGRMIDGSFSVVTVDDSLCLVVSTLSLDAHNAGPSLLCKRAYPLAKRPFFTSAVLTGAVGEMASQNGWSATAIDAMGYDRARRFRRDMKEQSVEDALAEMREQGRYVHRLEVSFADENSVEIARASFDRYASISIRRGDVGLLVNGFVQPAVAASVARSTTYAIDASPAPRQQEVLQLTFPNEPFGTYDEMNALCNALRKGEGLAVTILHLNPYLQAQVIDMLTGTAADMIVLDKSHVSLIPRSQKGGNSLERMTSTLLRHFGEAQVDRVQVQ